MTDLRNDAVAGIRALLQLRLASNAENLSLMQETPERAVKAFEEMTEGYNQNPQQILSKQFDADDFDEMVVLTGIRFVSLCEHHLLPFVGTADVGYVAQGRVVGLSKLARVTHCFARRLQLQERLGTQIAQAVEAALSPSGVGVILRAHHSCMGCRGVREQDAVMVTSTMLGVLRDGPEARSEFLALCQGGKA